MNTQATADLEGRVSTVLADILEMDASGVTAETSQANTPKWDSLHHLQLVMALEHELGVSFTMQEIGEMTSVETILHLLRQRV